MTNTFCNNADDVKLDAMMKHLPLLHPSVDASHLFTMQDTFSCIVHAPDSEFSFLHESAIIYYHGVLFASWYHCHKDELSGYTPIMGKRSFDEGKTWSHLELLGHDKTEKLMYCPPVYGICKDKLYLFMNTMVAPDHIHSLELYEYSEDDKKFHFLWSKQIPFKINTNVCTLSNGRFMIPGRVGQIDKFPNTPQILISESDDISGEWNVVRVQKDGELPDGSNFVHPETSAIIRGNTIYLFCRNDLRHIPIIYKSEDSGKTWSFPMSHDIPFSNSKIYSGTLSDGRNYVIGNIFSGRNKLAVFFTNPNELIFRKGYLLQDGYNAFLNMYPQWSYPCAYEANGNLYVIYTAQTDLEKNIRGAALSVIPLHQI